MDHDHFSSTLAALRSRTARIGVVGLGYVGLPLVRAFVDVGYSVVGFDVDARKAELLNAGKSYIGHIDASVVARMRAEGRFEATADLRRLAEVEAIVICVPTPLTAHREPDVSFIESTSEQIRDQLTPGQLIVLESTTYPGTLRGVMLPILEQSGKKVGIDFFLAYSPEREDPGNPDHTATSIPKVVGGIDPNSHELAVALYEPLVPRVVSVGSPEVAEASKILENTYRCVNIALVNELKMLFARMGIDIWEVIRAASTKPFGFQPFYPGPGLGGHCIPIDPFYLSWVARQFDFNTRFIELAGEVNAAMPDYVIHQVALALNSQRKAIRDSRIAILGMAYKKDVDDPRESPSFVLMERLLELGARVTYNDPHIPDLPRGRKHRIEMSSTELTPIYLREQDCILIATDHSVYDAETICRHAKLIVDTRNFTGSLKDYGDKIWPA